MVNKLSRAGHWIVRAACWIALVCICGSGCQKRNNSAQPKLPAPKQNIRVIEKRTATLNGNDLMLAELQDILDNTDEMIDWLGDAKARRMRQSLAELSPSAPPSQQIFMGKELALLELRIGNELQAIDLLLNCRKIMAANDAEDFEEIEPGVFSELCFLLGVAHMRLAETQNCCNRNTPDSCVVPIQGGGIHSNPYGSTEAIRWFERVLQAEPLESERWFRALWLYNIAHMTLDRYPDQVPEAWRVPETVFQTKGSFPAFKNIAQAQGVDTFSLCGGAIADDFDRDGNLDLVVSTSDTHGQIRYFQNKGQGTFVDRKSQAGLMGLYGGLNLVQTDYDNDGFLDILVLRGGWFQDGGRHPNSLLHNNGDGTFTDVTFDSGLQGRAPTQTASWADYDNDGDLDLYIGNETTRSVPIYSELYRNNADGTFTNVAEQAGVLNNRFAKSVVWGDFNNDRLPDLYVSNFGSANRLYRNKGDGTFIDIARPLDVTGPLQSFPVWFWDVNNDGVLDIFVSAYADDIAWLAASYRNVEHKAESARLYLGDGKGGFAELAEQYGITAPAAPMGSNFGDLDNDGFLDFYLGTGEPEYHSLMPNTMYHNKQGKRFVDVTMAGRFGHLQKGHAVVFADLDNDGDQDVFEQLGGAYPGDRFYDAFFENPGFENNWVALNLVGTQSNRAAIGTRIRVVITENGVERSIYRTVNSGGSFGANPLMQSIGIGKAERVDLIEISWPAGRTQLIHDLPCNQTFRFVEDQNRQPS